MLGLAGDVVVVVAAVWCHVRPLPLEDVVLLAHAAVVVLPLLRVLEAPLLEPQATEVMTCSGSMTIRRVPLLPRRALSLVASALRQALLWVEPNGPLVVSPPPLV